MYIHLSHEVMRMVRISLHLRYNFYPSESGIDPIMPKIPVKIHVPKLQLDGVGSITDDDEAI